MQRTEVEYAGLLSRIGFVSGVCPWREVMRRVQTVPQLEQTLQRGVVVKKILLAVTSLALLASNAASAADLAVKTPPVAVTPNDWAGFYLGGHAGYAWGHDPFREALTDQPLGLTTPFPGLGPAAGPVISGVNSRGWAAGGYAGYNLQRRAWVGGIEADFSASDIKGSNSNTALFVTRTISYRANSDQHRPRLDERQIQPVRLGTGKTGNVGYTKFPALRNRWTWLDPLSANVLQLVLACQPTSRGTGNVVLQHDQFDNGLALWLGRWCGRRVQSFRWMAASPRIHALRLRRFRHSTAARRRSNGTWR